VAALGPCNLSWVQSRGGPWVSPFMVCLTSRNRRTISIGRNRKRKEMGVPGKRTESRRRVERRERILEAAREIFSHKRYNEVTVALITSEVGIAKGTFYLYFHSKEDLFLEVIRDAGLRLRRAVAEVAADIDDPLEKIRASVPVIFDIYRQEASLYQAIFQQASFLESERYEEYVALYDPIAKDFQNTIEEGVRRGIFKVGNPKVLSHGVFGFLASLIHQWLLLESEGGAPEGYLEEMSDTVNRFFSFGLTGESFLRPGALNDRMQDVYRHQLDEVRQLQGELERLEKTLLTFT
jgi:AcrR family transcriptional regulator